MAFYHALNLIGELYDNAEVYFKEHASDLCKPGTKQGETKLAFFGVKIGMPTVIKTIRDTYRRKLVKANFPQFPAKFDAHVRYTIDGPIRTRHSGLPSTYYATLPFKVNIRPVQ